METSQLLLLPHFCVVKLTYNKWTQRNLISWGTFIPCGFAGIGNWGKSSPSLNTLHAFSEVIWMQKFRSSCSRIWVRWAAVSRVNSIFSRVWLQRAMLKSPEGLPVSVLPPHIWNKLSSSSYRYWLKLGCVYESFWGFYEILSLSFYWDT